MGDEPASAAVRGDLTALLAALARAPEGPEPMPWAEGLRPGDVFDRFEILRELGRGGFGAVYEALDRELGRRVALKTLRPGRTRDEWSDAELRREAQAAARLSHPGIVTLHEACTCEKGPYLVLELLRGQTLEERLSRGPLPVTEAVEVGLQVARALAYVHGEGLVHRDLKPGNVHLGEDGRVKLLDLGLAHLLGRKGQSAGTPAYVAPEQWRGEVVDGKADVFSLGAVLFEALAGQRPFEVREGRTSALDGGPAPALQAKVPWRLGLLLGRCLADEPAKRPTAAQAAEELLAVQRAQERPRAVRRFGFLAAAGVAAGVALAAIYLWRAGPRAPAAGAQGDAPTPSIAVLPFVDMSPKKDQEYFADGVAEEILNGLTQVDGLRVIGRTSSFSFKGTRRTIEEIGRELTVVTLLEGSVRKSGERVRISAQLVRAADGSHLWAQTFDRELADVFAVQDEISRAVVAALRVRLLPGTTTARSGKTGNPEALSQYLLGRDLLRYGGVLDAKRALKAFEKAVSLDPHFALAWAGVADALHHIESVAGEGTSLDRRNRALAAAQRAVEIAPQQPDGYLSRGGIRSDFLYDWQGARADLEQARIFGPGNAYAATQYAYSLLRFGDLTGAITEFERATSIDPLSPGAWSALGRARASAGQYDRARVALTRALEIEPRAVLARWLLIVALVGGGRSAAALTEAERSELTWVRLTGVALAQHDLGHPRESQAALEALVRGNAADSAYQIAEVHAWRGETDLAFEWLERARLQFDPGMAWAKTDPMFRKIRGDPRFPAFLRKLNLPVD